MLEIWGNRKRLIFLEAHDNASFFDHELQSDTFKSRIEDHLVAIAPAQIVSDDICYKSFNYASEKDIVHLADVLLGSLYAAALGEEMQQNRLLEIWGNRKQLIFLETHANASFFDHELQSDTFKFKIEDHLADYTKKKGEYQ